MGHGAHSKDTGHMTALALKASITSTRRCRSRRRWRRCMMSSRQGRLVTLVRPGCGRGGSQGCSTPSAYTDGPASCPCRRSTALSSVSKQWTSWSIYHALLRQSQSIASGVPLSDGASLTPRRFWSAAQCSPDNCATSSCDNQRHRSARPWNASLLAAARHPSEPPCRLPWRRYDAGRAGAVAHLGLDSPFLANT
jgi:hypothetical protein